MEAVEELCPEKANLFKTISLAPNTVARRIDDIGSNIVNQIAEKAKKMFWCILSHLMSQLMRVMHHNF